jgi:hypothetical protein
VLSEIVKKYLYTLDKTRREKRFRISADKKTRQLKKREHLLMQDKLNQQKNSADANAILIRASLAFKLDKKNNFSNEYLRIISGR